MSRRSNAPLPLAVVLVALVGALYRYGCTAATTPGGENKPAKPSRTRNTVQPTAAAGDATANASPSNDGNLLLGNPLIGGPKIDSFILSRPQYALSYNHTRGEANWVAWHTDASNLGHTRRGKFRPDPDLPEAWQITPEDYTGSGFDRGHLCPSGDRTDTRKNNDATFYMSNMVPQAKELNQKIWAHLEDYLRDQVRDGREVYVIAGGRGNAGTIAGGKVVVPEYCWKIAVLLPAGQNDLQRIPTEAEVLAVEMKNEENPAYGSEDWRKYLTTVSALEKSTGFNFFQSLSPEDQSKLENSKYSG